MDSVFEKIENTPSKDKKSILCIVPLPPPITGAAIASETVVNYLKQRHEVVVMPYQRGNLISGKFSLKQAFRIITIGLKIIRFSLSGKTFDHIYLVISSSFWGNMRDLFFLFIMGSSLRKRLVIHLHGANVDIYFKVSQFWVKFLNKVMLKDVKAAIVLGETFQNIFSAYISQDKIRIVKNYFEPYLLITEEGLKYKFESPNKINILFLSNLIKEKGYEMLLDIFLALPENISNKAVLHFAGEVYSPDERNAFVTKIKNKANILYHGPLTGEAKKKVFWDSHIFCLPSVYMYEGQPISILEAYASGCVVLTTNNGGIRDIFVEGKNGFFVDEDLHIDRETLKKYIMMLITDIHKYKDMAEFNRREASIKYTRSRFVRNCELVILG